MEGKLSNLIESNFGKAAFYTPEENARYGGVNLNCCERILRGANIALSLIHICTSFRITTRASSRARSLPRFRPVSGRGPLNFHPGMASAWRTLSVGNWSARAAASAIAGGATAGRSRGNVRPT